MGSIFCILDSFPFQFYNMDRNKTTLSHSNLVLKQNQMLLVCPSNMELYNIIIHAKYFMSCSSSLHNRIHTDDGLIILVGTTTDHPPWMMTIWILLFHVLISFQRRNIQFVPICRMLSCLCYSSHFPCCCYCCCCYFSKSFLHRIDGWLME